MRRRLTLFALLSSCSVDLQIPDAADIACESDDDCPSGFICDVRSQCRSPEVAARGVPGFDITPTTVTVGESGTPTVVNVRLTAQPTAAVTLVLAPDDGSEAFISKNVLTFTPENYNIAQAVTVVGERDCLADGPIVSHILISPAQSLDPDYNGLDAPDLEVTTNDDVPSAGIVVTPPSGLETNESGNVTQFTVVVACKPTADVHFTLASTDETEGTITTTELTFTPDNWAVPRVINVAGKGDCETDGDVTYAVDLGRVASDDPLYAGIDAPNVELVNRDVVFGRVNVSPNNGLRTTEGGGQATFSVTLTCAPSANVIVPIGTGDGSEGTPGATTSLTFTPANWGEPQAVIITGVNDFYDDGNIAYAITTGTLNSTDLGFNGLDPVDVSVTNEDDDTASVTVTPTTGLHTTEAAGTAQFSIQLGAEPLSPVQIAIASTDTAEGTVVGTTVTIADRNPRFITITGVNDPVDDDNKSYTITLGDIVSSDPAFSGMAVPDVAVINDDDDTAGFTRWENAVYVTEAGSTADVRLSLASRPSADVNCVVDDTFNDNEIRVGTTGSVNVTFTPVTYGLLQSVTVTGVNDGVADGLSNPLPSVRTQCTSADPKYNGMQYYVTAYTIEPASSRRVYQTATAGYTGNQIAITTADTICQNNNPIGSGTWKAMLTSSDPTAPSALRRACTTPNCVSSSENQNWVFRPAFTYYWSGVNGIVGTTNAAGIFTGMIDGTPPSSGTAGFAGYWTGMSADFTNNANCNNWSTTSGTGSVGLDRQSTVGNTFGWNPGIATFDCTQTHQLLCIEQ